MKTFLRASWCAAFILPFICSCAAMFSGIRADVKFTAIPSEGSTVIVGGEEHRVGKELHISKWTRSVTFRNKKFGDVVVPVEREFEWDYILWDVLFTPGFGLVGIAVDWPTAAWYEFPERVFLNFSTGEVLQRIGRESYETNVRD